MFWNSVCLWERCEPQCLHCNYQVPVVLHICWVYTVMTYSANCFLFGKNPLVCYLQGYCVWDRLSLQSFSNQMIIFLNISIYQNIFLRNTIFQRLSLKGIFHTRLKVIANFVNSLDFVLFCSPSCSIVLMISFINPFPFFLFSFFFFFLPWNISLHMNYCYVTEASFRCISEKKNFMHVIRFHKIWKDEYRCIVKHMFSNIKNCKGQSIFLLYCIVWKQKIQRQQKNIFLPREKVSVFLS